MANYSPSDAITLVRKYCRDVPVTSIDSQVCDIIHSRIWTYYPWKWSQAALTAIALVDAQQDYTVSNSDFYRLLRARLVRTDATPDDIQQPLDIRNSLEPTNLQGSYVSICAIAYEPVTSKLRLEYAASITGSETVEIQGEYQKKPTKIDDSALATPFLFDDVYFGVFVEGLKWKLYQFVDDKRAGSIVMAKDGRRTYSGQLGVFMDGLAELAAAEDYSGQEGFYPETPMGAAYGTY